MQGGIDKTIRTVDGWNEAAMDPWLMDTLDPQAQPSHSLIKQLHEIPGIGDAPSDARIKAADADKEEG